MADLKCMKRVLRRMGYSTAADVIEVKGRIACELSSADELLLTEMMFNGMFNEMSPEQVILSSYVVQFIHHIEWTLWNFHLILVRLDSELFCMRREVERGAEVDAGTFRTTKTDARYGQTNRTGLTTNIILFHWLFYNQGSIRKILFLSNTQSRSRCASFFDSFMWPSRVVRHSWCPPWCGGRWFSLQVNQWFLTTTKKQAERIELVFRPGIAQVSKEAKIELDEEEYIGKFKPFMMDVVFEWCKGAKFSQICKMTELFEGTHTLTYVHNWLHFPKGSKQLYQKMLLLKMSGFGGDLFK